MIKKYAPLILFFAAISLVFLGNIIFMKSGFIAGDYLSQAYPWSRIYSESIKSLNLPFWTRYFQSGFPLIAEGQIGGLYPLNMIMFLLLPFKVAYNYSTLLHFAIAGIFTSLYTRKLGAGNMGGALAALCFCFGGAFAGGVALKTMAWFPVVLLLFEYAVEKKRVSYFLITGFIAGMQFLAGFLQIAAYAFILYIVYLLISFSVNRIRYKTGFAYLLVFTAAAAVISMPQLYLTMQLAQYTARDSALLEFALWGSFAPPLMLSAFFPYWLGQFGQQVFIGSLSMLFLIYGLLCAKDSPRIRPLIAIGALSLLAAMGRYNPLYVLLIRATEFYGLRNPSKFLFFTLFAASVLAGFGFSLFFKNADVKRARLSAKLFLSISALSALIFSFAGIFLRAKKEWFFEFLRNYIMTHVAGKPHHRYDISEYMARIPGIYKALIARADPSSIFTFLSLIMLFTGILLAIYLIKRVQRSRWFAAAIFCVIFLDIFVYSLYGTGFRGNIKEFNYVEPTHKKILGIIKGDKELFRIAPFDLTNKDMPWWIIPNANILVGLDSIAAYSPLAQKKYYEKLGSLEVVDNALGLLVPDEKAIADNYPTLSLLNVKYIISSRKLHFDFIREIASEDNVFLYGLNGYMPRIFFSYSLGSNLESAATDEFKIIEYKDGLARIRINTKRNGYLILSETYYPGWKAYIDQKKTPLQIIEGIVQGVFIEKGPHEVVFCYAPEAAVGL